VDLVGSGENSDEPLGSGTSEKVICMHMYY
jgi:hypothetical protein